MYCKECGNRLREGARFCDDCGAKVVSEEEKNSEVTANDEVADNTVQPAEEPKESWNDTKEVKKHSANNRKGIIYFRLMTISIIWLALSGFMPMVYERSIFNKEVYTFMEIGDIYYIFVLNGTKVLSSAVFLCKASYVAGIIFVIVYFLKLFLGNKDSNKICKISLFTSILYAISTVIIYIIQFLINIKMYEILGEKYMSFTFIGWITIAVIIINIILSCKLMLMSYKMADKIKPSVNEPQKIYYDEKVEKSNSTIKRNALIFYLLMTFSLIWLALSGFMPMVIRQVGLAKKEYSILKIYFLCLNNNSSGLMINVSVLCQVLYITGIIMVLAYFIKLLSKCKVSNIVCKLSLTATILLAIPTLVMKLLTYNFTSAGWFTIAVIILNIIVTLIFMKMSNKKKHNIIDSEIV